MAYRRVRPRLACPPMTDPIEMWCRVQAALARLAANASAGGLPLDADRLWQRLQSDASFREGLAVGRMLRRELDDLEAGCDGPPAPPERLGGSERQSTRRGCWATELLLTMLTAPREPQPDAGD